MAPNEDHVLQLKSILSSFVLIFKKLNILTVEKQEMILNQNWTSVFRIANEQDEIVRFINSKDKELYSITRIVNNTPEGEIQSLKSQIKELIVNYKEIENINARLLNDNLFAFKQKYEKVLQFKNEKDTYEKDLKKKNNIFENRAYLLNKFA